MNNNDYSRNITTQPTLPDPTDHSASASSSSAQATPATTSTPKNQEKSTGRWTDEEIKLLLDYVEANCALTTASGLTLKKAAFNQAHAMVKSKDAAQCHYKWGTICNVYRAISAWDKKSGSGWHDDYGANAQTASEKAVLEEFLKTPEHGPLKAYATKGWPHYRRMQAFMPGTQPRGTHAFDPGSLSSQLTTQSLLNVIDTEEDGVEDQLDPPMATVSHIPLDLGIFSSSLITPSLPPQNSSASSSSAHTKPPPSSSISLNPPPIQQFDVSMSSVHSSITTSDAGTNRVRKRKSDARSASGIQPPSSKRASKSRTNDLNPVIISNSLNSTLNRIVDVMERSLDATAAAAAAAPSNPTMTSTTSPGPPSLINSSINSSQSSPLPPSPTDVLDRVVRIISGSDTCLSEDQLLSASLFFASASDDAVRTARTFLSLEQNPTVQYRFLLSRLKGKARAVEDDGDHSMV